MANDPKHPLVGELSIDATDLTFLVDLEPGARVRLRSAQPGIDAAVREILANQVVNRGIDVVPDSLFHDLTLVEERIAQIDAKLPAGRKLVEILEETRALLDDQRQRIVSAVASMAEAQARALGDNSLLARYEKTRACRSAIALKAARTRRRNQDGALDIEESSAAGPAALVETTLAAGIGTSPSPLVETRPATPAADLPRSSP